MTQDTEDVVARVIAKLRHSIVLCKGETIMLDMGDEPKPVSSGDVVQQRNPDGPQAADIIETLQAERQSLSDRIDVLEGALSQAAEALESVMRDEYDAFYVKARAAAERARAALHQEGIAP